MRVGVTGVGIGLLVAGLACTKAPEAARPALAVSVDATQRAGLAPFTLELTSTVTGAEGAVTWAWDFGDGDTASAPGPVHVYTDPGSYDVTLVVTDGAGRTASTGLSVSVGTDEIPAAGVSSDVTSGRAPLAVEFTCDSSAGNAPFEYLWDFADGTVAPGATASHTYTDAGTFTARCVVTDANGDTGFNTVDVHVDPNLQPVAAIGANPASGVAPLTIDFNATVLSGDPPFTYDWDFGDGTTSTQEMVSHSYTDAGTFLATLTVTDADGDTGSDTAQIAVGTDSVPSVAASASPASGVSPLSVEFRADVAGGDAPLTFAWDFGDGQLSSLPDPVNTYNVVADTAFDVTLTVTDADGDVAMASTTVNAFEDVVPTALVGAFLLQTTAPATVLFQCNNTGGNAPLTFAWDFGDGTTSSLQDPSHVYPTGSPDGFPARCTVTDANGDTATDQVLVVINPDTSPANPAISAVPLSGTAPLDVDFTSVVSGGNGILSYEWILGDGTTVLVDDDPTLTHTYASAGTYGVVLRVTDQDGDVGIATVEVQAN